MTAGKNRHIRPTTSRRTGGYTLIELLVATLVLAEVMVAVLLLLQGTKKLSEVQTSVADLQQNHRISQAELVSQIRDAGLGGLPASIRQPPAPAPPWPAGTLGLLPNGLAVAVRNNVPDMSYITVGDNSSDLLVTGSDVLTIRGVFSTPVYYFTPPLPITNTGFFTPAGTDLYTVDTQQIILTSQIGNSNIQQPVTELRDALQAILGNSNAAAHRVPLLLRDTENPCAYAVVELVPGPPTDLTDPDTIILGLTLSSAANVANYSQLMRGTCLQAGSGGNTVVTGAGTVEFPPRIGSVALLDEYRYHLRADWVDPTDNSSRLTPVLARARYLAGTEVQIDTIDIADNVLDLQAALGFNANAKCPENCAPAELLAATSVVDDHSGTDHVLYNHDSDDAVLPPTGLQNSWGDDDVDLLFVRVSTLVQAGRIDRDYRAPALGFVEDSDRSTPFALDGVNHDLNDLEHRRFRRRLLTTTVDLRNVK